MCQTEVHVSAGTRSFTADNCVMRVSSPQDRKAQQWKSTADTRGGGVCLGATSMKRGELQRVPTCTRNPKERRSRSARTVWYLVMIPSGHLPMGVFWWRPPRKMYRCMYGCLETPQLSSTRVPEEGRDGKYTQPTANHVHGSCSDYLQSIFIVSPHV